MEDKFKVEDRVILVHTSYMNLHGILRYKGPIEGTSGTWLGVELDEAKGKNSGDHKNVSYFKCESNHGVFVRVNHLRLESEALKSQDESPTKLVTDQSNQQPVIKLEKPTEKSNTPNTEKNLVEKPALQKPPVLEKPKEKGKTAEESKVKVPEKPAEKKTVQAQGSGKEVVKQPLSISKKPTVKDPPPTSNVKKPVAVEKKPIITEKKSATPIGTVKKTPVSKKPIVIAKKPKEEDSKSNESKEEPAEENEDEVVEPKEEIKEENPISDEITITSSFNPESTQIDTEDTKIEAMVEELKVLKNEVDEKAAEILSKETEISELKASLADMTKRVLSLEEEKKKIENSADFENLNNLKLMQAEQKLKETERKYRHLENDHVRLKKEFELQKDHLQQHESFTHMVEGLTIENESLKANIEALTMELEQNKSEIKKLKEENEIIQLEIEEAMEMPQIESTESGSEDIEKLKENNGKLRLAIQILNEKYENEQILHLEQIERYKLALERIPDLQLRVKELDEKKALLALKEQEVEELKNRLDEGSEYQEMIEMLTNDLMKKEEEIIDLKRTIKDLKEERDVNNQLIEATEEEIKELTRLNEARDQEIFALAKKIKDRDEALEDREKYINKFREKLEATKKELEMYKDNAQKTGGEESRNMKRIEELLQKQQEILAEKRDNYRKMLNYSVINFKLSNEVLTCNTFLKTLPSIFLEKLHLDAFNKFSLLRTLRGKTKFLADEIQETYFKPQQAKENIDLVNWLSKGLIYMSTVIFCLDFTELAMMFLNSEDEYLEFTKNSFFGTCTAIQVIIDSMLRTHREEAISVKVPIEPLKILSSKLLEQTLQISKKYLERSEDILDQETSRILNFLRIAKSLYRNKFELNKAKINTVNLWYTCLNRGVENPEKFEKSVLKINDSMEKLTRKICLFLQIKSKQDNFIMISRSAVDKILGEDVFNEEQEQEIFNTVSVLVEYYEKVVDEFISDKDNYQLRIKDIFDKLDNLCSKLVVSVPAIKRFSLSNDGNLIYDPISAEAESVDEFQAAGLNVRVFGPWDLCSQRMNDELKKVLDNVENFEKMNIELKEQVKKLMKLEEELKAVNLVKENLEVRVAELQNKAERVAVLEGEKKRMQEREQHFNEATEAIKKELENAEKKNREIEEELNEIKSGAGVANLPLEVEPQTQSFNRRSVFKSASKETLMPYSRISVMGPGNVGGEVMRGGGGFAGINITGNMQVESTDSMECWDVVQRLLAENCYLKSSEIRERLQKLKVSMPKFSKYHEEIKNMNESGSLYHSLVLLSNKLSTVQKKAQKKLAEAKIIDLEKISGLSIMQKNESADAFLINQSKPLESLKAEAYSATYGLFQNFKPEMDEHRFQTYLDSGFHEALKTSKNCKLVGGLQFAPGSDLNGQSLRGVQRLVITSKEYREFTQRILRI